MKLDHSDELFIGGSWVTPSMAQRSEVSAPRDELLDAWATWHEAVANTAQATS
jgi:hypothetical protein